MSGECRRKLFCLFFALRQQRQIGAACVSSVFGPFGGSVSKQPELTFVIHGVDQCAVVLVAVDLVAVDLVAVLFLLSPNVKPVMPSDGNL